MAYRKFDDPAKSRSNDIGKVYPVFPSDSERRALQGVLNRVIWGGTGGTHTTSLYAGCGTGSTGGVKITNVLGIAINGRIGTAFNRDNMELPAGTQSANTVVKYLVSSGFGTSGTVTAGNEGTSSTKAFLPDCPDGHVAVGYFEYATTAGNAFVRTNKALTGHSAATAGTINEWVNLVHMPLNEA